ncbi:DUF2637 domain-containing protein [Nocardiopsis exhalans]|uniref:DUF2637 domain-containing protein n=2 Tax=Nocardiopsis exhalans TaxID=163604 RepID=A0ABY5D5V6_9ACTN|nr:DUF2637 domain-containing protein [Nocardiopsis exhalans]USY19744.1 DUF2637 domain-containing protein [Nocardiopsis exhalans]
MRNLPIAYYATITGSLAIAVGLVVVSYGHIRKFAMEAGAAPWEAAVIAVTVDALVVLSIAAIGHARGVGQRPPAMAKVALVVGVVATTGANIHHGLDHGWAGIVVSLWVPVAAELAYQLAMSAVRVGATGHQEKREVVCGHRVSVATVMARVHARPVICGQDVPVAMLAATLAAVRRPAPRDPRPAICSRVVAMATLAATMPPRPVATLEDPRPDICGAFVATQDVAMPDRQVVCTRLIPAAEVAMPPVDTRRPVCTRPVTVAEVLALSPVAMPAPAATEERPGPTPRPRPAPRPVATAEDVAAREVAILDWIAEADDPDARMADARGPEVAAVLAAAGHHVSARTARRDLQAVRDQLATTAAT